MPGVRGSRDDVRTKVGVYDGYQVVADCRGGVVFGVIGLGDEWFDGVAPEQEGRELALGGLLGSVEEGIRELDIPYVAYLEAGCRAERTVYVGVHDWHHVDAVVLRMGALLRQRNLAEEIAVAIEVPVVGDTSPLGRVPF